MKYCTAKKGIVQAMIAYKVDRISRNIADYSVIRGTLKRYGVEIRSVTEFFEDTPAGRFMENIIANVGQFDNDVRAERSRGGMLEATKEGRYVWKAPLGYKNEKISGKSTIIPDIRAPLIKMAFELVSRQLYSTNTIRRMIAKEGLVNKKGMPISPSNFYILIRNSLYKGVIVKFGNTYPGAFDPIVPCELFDRVQAIIEGRKHSITHYLHENPDFPLRGFFKNENGLKITGYWAQGRRMKYPYYSYKLPGTVIRKEEVERKFMEFLSHYEFDARHFNRMQFHLRTQLKKQSKCMNKDYENIELKISAINKKIDSLIALQTQGGISLYTFSERVKKHETEIEELKDFLKTRDDKDYDIDALMSFAKVALKTPQIIWQKCPYNIKQKLQVFDFPEGIIFDGKICRTTKVCKLFKLKDDLEAEIFSKGGSTENFTNNSKKLTSTPSCDLIHTRRYWEFVANELLRLKNILEGKKEVPDQEEEMLYF